jgi:hypothetical protein
MSLDRFRHDAEHAGQEVSAFARAIVAKRAVITAAITTLVTLGIIPQTTGGSLEHWLEVVATAAGLLGGIVWTQRGTTPADPALQPKSSNGTPLVEAASSPASTLGDLAAVNAALDSAAASEQQPSP